MKMANIDAAFDWMFTNPRSTDGVSVVLQSHAEKLSSFYEKIVCSLSFLPIIRTSWYYSIYCTNEITKFNYECTTVL